MTDHSSSSHKDGKSPRGVAQLLRKAGLRPTRQRLALGALLFEGEKIGRLTSGGYSVAFGRQIGMGYVRPDLAAVGQRLKVRMLRQDWDAVVVEDSPHDPANARIRVDG